MRSETIAFVVVIVVVLLVVGFVGVMFLWTVGAVVTPRPSLRVPALIVGLVLVITGIGVVAALLNPGGSAAPGPTVTVSGSGRCRRGRSCCPATTRSDGGLDRQLARAASTPLGCAPHRR